MTPPLPSSSAPEVRGFLRTATVFVLLGLALYGGLYALSEGLISRLARTNKFHVVHAARATAYDFVILGSSHAAALGYQDMTAELEVQTGRRLVNLAIVGGGIRVNRLLYDYFLARHRTTGLVYVVDSFAFYSPQWNEDRLQDTRLWLRAPFDPTLASLLIRHADTRSTGISYALGFSKINNKDRFEADVTPEESTRFVRTYRPVKQIDDQRLAYLYPATIDQAVVERYLTQFEALLTDARARGIRVLVVKPPLPERVLQRMPSEAQFDARLRAVLDRHDIPLHDFSRVGNADALFFDTDHLNRMGVREFFARSLAPLLAASP